MSTLLSRTSVPLLRWTLAVVVILESAQFVVSARAAHFFATMGLPPWLRPALGLSEILAAILFLVPTTAVAGGYLLLAVFAVAALVHVLHGQYGIGGLAVYAVAALVCVNGSKNETAEASHE